VDPWVYAIYEKEGRYMLQMFAFSLLVFQLKAKFSSGAFRRLEEPSQTPIYY
jgi:hypothetical protein